MSKTKYRDIRVSAQTRRTLKMLKKATGCHSMDDLLKLMVKEYIFKKGGI